jgi:hypothetical protein
MRSPFFNVHKYSLLYFNVLFFVAVHTAGMRLCLCTAQPPTGLLFIPKVIYEYREPWWNDDADRRKLLSHPPELSGNLTSSHLVAKHEEHVRFQVLTVASTKILEPSGTAPCSLSGAD